MPRIVPALDSLGCAGGLIGMLALNGIFVLVTQHGLEYPNFYARLYALVDRDAFQVGGHCVSLFAT